MSNDIPVILDCPNCKQNMLKGSEFLLQTFQCDICDIKINFDIMSNIWNLMFKNYSVDSFGNIDKINILNLDPILIDHFNSKTYKLFKIILHNNLDLNIEEAYLYLLKFIENEMFI